MLAYCHRSNTRATAAVRNAKSFMQIQVTHVCAKHTRLGETDKGIEICAVNIHLSTCVVNDATHFCDAVFKDSVR